MRRPGAAQAATTAAAGQLTRPATSPSTARALEEETATTGLCPSHAARGYFRGAPRSHTRCETISLGSQSRYQDGIHLSITEGGACPHRLPVVATQPVE